jgi:cell division transport system ATP-binding protein
MRYPSGDVGLDQATFSVAREEFVFLVGSTGSGKSTVMRLLIKELELSEGRITVAGRDLSDVTRKRVPYYRRNIGVVFQDFKLLPHRTVADNVGFALDVVGTPKDVVRDKALSMLKRVGLGHKADVLPPKLSGGEQQRVSIARALVNDPALLLADEPTGNLDPTLTVEIMDLLCDVNARGTTIVVATHDVSLIERYQKRTLRLERGQLVAEERGRRAAELMREA